MFDELSAPPPRPLPLACWKELRDALLPAIVAGAALVVLPLAAQVAFFAQHRQARALAQSGVAVEGTLVDKISGRFIMRLTVAYRGRDRRLHAVRQWVRASPGNRWLLLGDRTRVFYDPADPARAYLASLAAADGSLGRSLPVELASGLGVFAGTLVLVLAARYARCAYLLLQHGTLVTARLTRPPSWKNLWLAQYEITPQEKPRRHRALMPPGWRPVATSGGYAALAASGTRSGAILLVEPSPEGW